MRVTTASTYRNFTGSVNDVHLKLNKSLNKVSTGEAYERAADNPLAHYTGKKIDSQYLDTLSKNTLLTDVKNRLYQQELGARDIQDILSKAKNQVQYAKTATTTGEHDIDTIKQDLLQKQQTIVNDLNTQYQDFYVFGGNDVSTTPFSLSASEDQMVLTYSHIFPGETEVTEFKMTFKKQNDGSYGFSQPIEVSEGGNLLSVADGQNKLVKAMSEQGRIDIGYGAINDRGTLLDTYTGGLNILTGLNSDAVKAMNSNTAYSNIMDAMNKSPIALIGKAVLGISDYQNTGDKDVLDDVLGDTIDEMSMTEHTLSTSYSDLGNKYKLLEDTAKKLDTIEDSLTEQYKDILGADPYASIMEMYNYQYSYNAALQVGSKLLSSSLFDFL
ncbi:flagellar hook-basal body protein [Lachnospiraceae bacterium 62-35]